MSRAERAEKTDLAQRSQRAPSLSLRSRRPPREIGLLRALGAKSEKWFVFLARAGVYLAGSRILRLQE